MQNSKKTGLQRHSDAGGNVLLEKLWVLAITIYHPPKHCYSQNTDKASWQEYCKIYIFLFASTDVKNTDQNDKALNYKTCRYELSLSHIKKNNTVQVQVCIKKLS